MNEHIPVMPQAVLRALEPKPGACIVDATVGLGGHAEAILAEAGGCATLYGCDRDSELLARAARRLERFGPAVRLFHAPFSRLRELLTASGVARVDGLLLDLGVCSAQLDDESRGFRFASEASLDMRFDRSTGETAAELLERLSEAELAGLLRQGEVPHARAVARALVGQRPLRTCAELGRALRGLALPRRRHDPATLVFQALRMAINDETAELEALLEDSLELLAPGGRLVVLSYHSGDDRRVKTFFAREVRGCICPPALPRCACGRSPRIALLTRGQGPDPEEVRRNPRARSARLRAGVRL